MNFVVRSYQARWFVLVVMLVFASVTGCSSQVSESDESIEPLTVSTMNVRRADGYQTSRSFVGVVESARRSQVSFELGGKIKEITVDEGDSVQAGATVARLDTDRLEQREQALTAAVQAHESQVELARLDQRRTKQAFQQNAVSQQNWDQARLGYHTRQAELEQREAELGQVRVDLEKSVLHVPYDAQIQRRFVDEGNVVQAGESVFEIVERGNLEARVGLAGDWIDKLQRGDTVSVQVNDVPYSGLVKAMLPVRDDSSRTVDVIVELPDPRSHVRPGDRATLMFSDFIHEGGFWLPTTALVEGPRGLWGCYVIEPSNENTDTYKVVQRDLTILHQTSDRVYVRGTLQHGDRVIRSGTHRVVSGQLVVPDGQGGQDSS